MKKAKEARERTKEVGEGRKEGKEAEVAKRKVKRHCQQETLA